MCKKTIFLFLIFQLYSVFAQVQNTVAKQISMQKTSFDEFVGFDGIGNLYYINNNILYKKTENELWHYKNVSLGKITKVDFQNQLKIMLYYENFNAIILLDNQLSETQKINLSENEIPILVSATGIASQNRLWIYNSLTQKIGLYDYLKNTFKSITPSIQGNLRYYESDFNTFQWIDDKLNWYSCDVFGKIRTLGRVADFDQMQIVSNQKIILSKGGELFLQDLSKNNIYTIENVDKTFENFYYKDQILSIFTNQEITNYKITIP